MSLVAVTPGTVPTLRLMSMPAWPDIWTMDYGPDNGLWAFTCRWASYGGAQSSGARYGRDHPGIYGSPSCKTQCQWNSRHWVSFFRSNLRSLERGLASWRVRHRNGRHVVSSAQWPVGAPVLHIRRPSPSLRGPVMHKLTRFTTQASAVALRLCVLPGQIQN